MGKIDFANWLKDEIEARGWTASEFARRADVSQAMVSFVVNQQHFAGPDFCTGVARAFRLPPEVVFRRAGLLPPKPSVDPLLEEALHYLNQLTHEQREFVMIELRALAAQRLKEMRVGVPLEVDTHTDTDRD